MKVYVTSCETGPDAWRHQEGVLKTLWASSSKKHTLVSGPEEADIILVGNLREENWYESLRRHPVIGRYPNKSFIISEEDQPKPLLRGIYSSTSRRTLFRSRMRTGSFALQHPDFQNPLIQAYGACAWEKPKEFLATFMGRNSHPVRAQIFNTAFRRRDIFVEDTSKFHVFTHDSAGKHPQQKSFFEYFEKSKFAVCPRGIGTGSIRLYEAMKMGVAPVIVADDWVLPKGPRWEEFAIFVSEREIGQLEEVLSANESRYALMGQMAARAYVTYFSVIGYFDYVVDQSVDIMNTQWFPESIHWRARNVVLQYWKGRQRLQRSFRNIWRSVSPLAAGN